MKYHTLINMLFFVMGMIFLQACSASKPYTLGPVKTFDPDTTQIPQPEEAQSYHYWDRIDNTIFHQVEKPLDLNRVFRFTGKAVGIAEKKEADNINVLDEVPESSWYNYRHFYSSMTHKELARGPNTILPDTTAKWTIFSAKLEGANPGFFIEDSKGDRYLIKFDGPNYPELGTSAEVISTKFFYASGYNVPESVITHFHPDSILIEPGVMVEEQGTEREMTQEDYRHIISVGTKRPDGKIRALASKFVNGIPLGPWYFEGTRKDNPNDRVNHEHRREIRGMRIISSWLNDTDRRDANTMAVYTSSGYIKHLVQDFGNTLGANGAGIHTPIYGQAYLIDPRYMALSAVSFGFLIHPWERIEVENHIPYRSAGYFRSDIFRPGGWVSAHPLPAFENMTLRDAYWGAKQVLSFRDDDIRSIVETGELSNKAAEEYLIQILIERRDKIGRYWFSKINPLDKFTVKRVNNQIEFSFSDLGTEFGIFETEGTRYQFDVKRIGENNRLAEGLINDTFIQFPAVNMTDGEPVVYKITITSHRDDADTEVKDVDIYVAEDQAGIRIAGINRES